MPRRWVWRFGTRLAKFMINLILTEDKNRVRHNYRARVATVAAGLLLSLLLIFLVGLGALYFMVNWRHSALTRDLETARSESGKVKPDATESELQGLAEKANVLKIDLETNLPVSLVWQRLVDLRRPGITWRGLFYSRSPAVLGSADLALDGNAGTRQQFLDFIGALKADATLYDIAYPIESLLNDEDIDFLINFKIKGAVATTKK